jgi:hypothetical protein
MNQSPEQYIRELEADLMDERNYIMRLEWALLITLAHIERTKGE